MELQWIISTETDTQPAGEVLGQWITVVVQEQAVVTQRRHGNTDLCQVVQILQYRHLPQQQPVRNILRHHVTAHKMLYGACLATMWPQYESIQSSFTVMFRTHIMYNNCMV